MMQNWRSSKGKFMGMREISNEKLSEILVNHKHWIHEDCCGWEDMKAKLSGADLSDANLRDANLYGVDLCDVNLCGADLSGADLRDANMSGANLCGTNMLCANLHGANLSDSNLSNANLCNTNMRGSNLYGADLSNANLYNANMRGANLYYANLHGAKNIPYIPYACPDTSSFIGYKRAKDGIVGLEILADARRSSGTSEKCRCDKAKVLGIYDDNKNLLDIQETTSNFNPNFIYRVGEIVEEPRFDNNRWDECAEGIHFFINFQEAVRLTIDKYGKQRGQERKIVEGVEGAEE